MKKYYSIIFSISILLIMIIGLLIWMRAFYKSVKDYQAPVQGLAPPAQPTLLPQTARVVIIVISGLGYETSQLLDLPMLERLRGAGATAVIQSEPPTYSQTAWMTLVTGAPADVNGAPPLDQAPEALSPTTVDTIFERAHRAGFKTALLGQQEWRYLIREEQLDEAFFVDTPGPEADQVISQAALPLLKNSDVGLVLIQFSGLAFATTRQGGLSSNSFQLAAETIDSHLDQISRSIDLNSAVLMILSDHGYIAPAGQGGDELEITRQPLVLIGKGVVPGSYSDVRQIDIAPTVTTLLGTAPPMSAYGRVLFEMMTLDQQNRTTAQLALTRQRIGLAQAYVTQIKGVEEALPEELLADLERGKVAFTQNNLSGAFQLALLTQDGADAQISLAKYSQIGSEQWSRLPIAATGMFIWFLIMWRRRGNYASLIMIATLVTIGLYHALFQLQGYHYSISSLNSFSQLPFDIARRLVVSLLAGGALMLIFLMLTNEENWLTLLKTAYGFSILATYLFALPLFLTFWQNGFTVAWYLPAVGSVFWQIMGLLEAMIAAIIGLLLPWPIMLLNVFVNWVRRNLSDTPSQSERDALPGLHL